MGYFKLFQSEKNNDWYFNLKAGNHEIILSSQGYSSKSGAENGIESVKKNGGEDDNFERKEAKNGQFYFNLKAGNGQIIGSSEMYTTKAARDNGISSVMKNAPDAEIKE
ncbi:YegP family protein [Lishizhenia sp.]|uniref:YegP family protein n=1 Tax=Lishizhenia sp. TaxID=2497594 RepID=UPI00299E31B6|nr:YegP family protein [Lishizhenia sp.]MDX1446507.1 YegP family protein [Lishizhenia sp.]